MSPHLYLIYAEDLNLLLNEAEKSSRIRGVKVARGNPIINHFLFVDNNIIFCKANTLE